MVAIGFLVGLVERTASTNAQIKTTPPPIHFPVARPVDKPPTKSTRVRLRKNFESA
jgi:hypothetical protein